MDKCVFIMEQLIIVFSIALLGALCVTTVICIKENIKDIKKVNGMLECKPHKWEYDHKGNMVCGRCGFNVSDFQ